MYTADTSLYKNVNHFLHCFPITIIGKFMNELQGIPHYIYLLQSSIEQMSRQHPLESDRIVYRGISEGASTQTALYFSMIDELIVFPSFTSTSTDRDYVITHFICGDDSMLFEITLHRGDCAALIEEYSAHPGESEVLIAASSVFKVDDVEYIDIPNKHSNEQSALTVPLVKLSYYQSWYDFDIDTRPPNLLIGGDSN
jgi:hypothetical protein